MKKKITVCFVCLSLLLVSLALRGQDTKTTRRVPLQAEVTHDGLSEKESKAWEIGLGGSLINWSRVSVTGFRSTPDNYFYNLKANHLMGGANLYIARELNRWFYLDLQGSVGLTKNISGYFHIYFIVYPIKIHQSFSFDAIRFILQQFFVCAFGFNLLYFPFFLFFGNSLQRRKDKHTKY